MTKRPQLKSMSYLLVNKTKDSSKSMNLWLELLTLNSFLPKKGCFSIKKEISLREQDLRHLSAEFLQ